MDPREKRVDDLILAWTTYRFLQPAPMRYDTLRIDLYNVRNSVSGVSYPAHLIDPDDEVMAAVEHYFLCRSWVGNGKYSALQMRVMKGVYNVGKEVGWTPRHNSAKPVTPPSAMQTKYQDLGILHGERDLATSGGSAPLFARPPNY